MKFIKVCKTRFHILVKYILSVKAYSWSLLGVSPMPLPPRALKARALPPCASPVRYAPVCVVQFWLCMAYYVHVLVCTLNSIHSKGLGYCAYESIFIV